MDLKPETLVFDVLSGHTLDIVGVASVEIIILNGRTRLRVTKPKDLRVIPRRGPRVVPSEANAA